MSTIDFSFAAVVIVLIAGICTLFSIVRSLQEQIDKKIDQSDMSDYCARWYLRKNDQQHFQLGFEVQAMNQNLKMLTDHLKIEIVHVDAHAEIREKK